MFSKPLNCGKGAYISSAGSSSATTTSYSSTAQPVIVSPAIDVCGESSNATDNSASSKNVATESSVIKSEIDCVCDANDNNHCTFYTSSSYVEVGSAVDQDQQTANSTLNPSASPYFPQTWNADTMALMEAVKSGQSTLMSCSLSSANESQTAHQKFGQLCSFDGTQASTSYAGTQSAKVEVEDSPFDFMSPLINQSNKRKSRLFAEEDDDNVLPFRFKFPNNGPPRDPNSYAYKQVMHYHEYMDFKTKDDIFKITFSCVGCSVVNLQAGSFPRLLECLHSICQPCFRKFNGGYCPKCLYYCTNTYEHFMLNALMLLDAGRAKLSSQTICCLKCYSNTAEFAFGEYFLCRQCLVGFMGYPIQVDNKHIKNMFLEYLKKHSPICLQQGHGFRIQNFCGIYKKRPLLEDNCSLYTTAKFFLDLGDEFPPFNHPGLNKYYINKNCVLDCIRKISAATKERIVSKPKPAKLKEFLKDFEHRLGKDFIDLLHAEKEYQMHMVYVLKLIHICAHLAYHKETAVYVSKFMPIMRSLIHNFDGGRFYFGKSYEELLPRVSYHCKTEFGDHKLITKLENSPSTAVAFNKKINSYKM